MVSWRGMRHGIVLSLLVSLALAIGGCGGKRIQRQAALDVLPTSETVYVLPFVSTLVPPAVSEAVFNDFVDILNDTRPIPGTNAYVILKDGLADLPQEWLTRQVYLAGDIWSYQENAGCCATQLKIMARLRLYQGKAEEPLLTITIPHERFFAHDRSNLADERPLLARTLARELSRHLARELRSHL